MFNGVIVAHENEDSMNKVLSFLHFAGTLDSSGRNDLSVKRHFMKFLLIVPAFGAAILLLGACENPPRKHPDDFAQKTHRTYNPETGTFEQSPPFGKQSNKSDDAQ
jgi:hypothetical protein